MIDTEAERYFRGQAWDADFYLTEAPAESTPETKRIQEPTETVLPSSSTS